MLKEYINSFGVGEIPQGSIVRIGDKLFISKKSRVKNMTYTGQYLGAQVNNKFVPSLDLLWFIKERTQKWITVNKKTEWLVVCGRDVWGSGIVDKGNDFKTDERVLVLTEEKDPIGVGRIVEGDLSKNNAVIKMQFDIGDFIRRGKAERRRNEDKKGEDRNEKHSKKVSFQQWQKRDVGKH